MIDFPASKESAAIGINNRGQITGYFSDRGGVFHGLLLDHGVFTQIDFPGAIATDVVAINDNGQIVGFFIDAGGVAHGFLATTK